MKQFFFLIVILCISGFSNAQDEYESMEKSCLADLNDASLMYPLVELQKIINVPDSNIRHYIHPNKQTVGYRWIDERANLEDGQITERKVQNTIVVFFQNLELTQTGVTLY